MADQEDKNGKSVETDNNPTNASQKLNGRGGPEKMTITNIYYDCLERIFDCLDFESLLNLADTCKRLQIGAAHYFGENFSEKCVILDKVNPRGIVVNDGNIVCTRLKHSLALLRCFGSKITRLTVKTGDIGYLEEYLFRFCGDALTKIFFVQQLPAFQIENCQQPFKNVETILVRNVVLKDQLAGIAHCFPFLNHLRVVDVSFDADFVGVQLPHLKSLYFQDSRDKNDIMEKDLINFLRVNPHLKILTIRLNKKVAPSKLLETICGNSSICYLIVSAGVGINMNVIEPMNAVQLTRFANEHPSIVKLYLPKYRFMADDAIAFIRQLKSLNSFVFSMHGHSEYDRFVNQLDEKWKVNLCNVFVDFDVRWVEITLSNQ